MQSQNNNSVTANQNAQYTAPIPNVIFAYRPYPNTRIPNPSDPVYIVRSEMNQPTVHVQAEPTCQDAPQVNVPQVNVPQVQFWLEKPAPTWKQLIKNWLSK